MKKNSSSQFWNQIERQKIIQFLKEKGSCNLYLLIMPGGIFVVEKKLVILTEKKIIKKDFVFHFIEASRPTLFFQ